MTTAPTADSALRIATCSDTSGFSSLWVMLHALMGSQRPQTSLELFLFHDSLSKTKLEALRRLCDCRPRTQIDFVAINPRQFFAGRPPFGLMSYARLLVPQHIQIGRVLYLDTDAIARVDLLHLMDWPMETALAAVPDRITGRSNCQHFLAQRGVDPETRYFNAGVLVIDCSRWNAQGITNTLLRTGAVENWNLPSGDQTLLNYHFRGEFDALPREYNTFEWAAAPSVKTDVEIDDVAIGHFLGRPKPWEIGGRSNLRYSRFKRMTDGVAFTERPLLEFSDAVAVARRVARYGPAYGKCVRMRLRLLKSAMGPKRVAARNP